jgi:hypothetical protein
MNLSELCNYIAEKGEPIIIATDVAKPPALVKKSASAFNALLFSPKKDITQTEKRKLLRAAKFSKKMKNKHEKDALAAALKARKRFLNFFVKIDSALKKKNLSHLNDDVKSLLIKRRVCNIEQAIKTVNFNEDS